MKPKRQEQKHAGEFEYKGYKVYRYPAAPNLWCAEDMHYNKIMKIYTEICMVLAWIDEQVSESH